MIMDRNGQIRSKTGHDHEAGPHEVVRALLVRREACSQPGARDDGLRIALAIEGGGMRGVISAGMALALDELGLVPAFDAIYGASAGAITGAWLVSRPDGLRGWAEPEYARILIRRSALLRGRPVADVRALVEDLYQTTYPMDFAAVLASPVELHPLATDAGTGDSTDLHPFIRTPADLRLALRASAALPLLAGPAVDLRRPPLLRRRRLRVRPLPHCPHPGRHPHTGPAFPPRPISQPDPHANGSRPPRASRQARASDQSRVSRVSRLLARTTLRRETPALRAAFLARESRRAADDQLLADYEAARRPNPPPPPRPRAPHRPQPRPPCSPSAPPPAHPWSAASPPTAPCCKPPSSPGAPPP